jgi:hypothetical protein
VVIFTTRHRSAILVLAPFDGLLVRDGATVIGSLVTLAWIVLAVRLEVRAPAPLASVHLGAASTTWLVVVFLSCMAATVASCVRRHSVHRPRIGLGSFMRASVVMRHREDVSQLGVPAAGELLDVATSP